MFTIQPKIFKWHHYCCDGATWLNGPATVLRSSVAARVIRGVYCSVDFRQFSKSSTSLEKETEQVKLSVFCKRFLLISYLHLDYLCILSHTKRRNKRKFVLILRTGNQITTWLGLLLPLEEEATWTWTYNIIGGAKFCRWFLIGHVKLQI